MTSRRATKRDGGRKRPSYEGVVRRTQPLYDRSTGHHIGYFDNLTGSLLTVSGTPSSTTRHKRNVAHVKRAWAANRERLRKVERAEYKINPA